jgi:hypothetical protein
MKYAQYAKYSCTITKSEKCDAGNISENGWFTHFSIRPQPWLLIQCTVSVHVLWKQTSELRYWESTLYCLNSCNWGSDDF